jgi:hypothetical protein
VRGFFLCGCPVSKVTSDKMLFDSEHFRICEEHGVRLYGWRTPLKDIIAYDDNGEPYVIKRDIDWSTMCEDKSFEPVVGKDQRDNSRPEDIGYILFARNNGGRDDARSAHLAHDDLYL